MEHSKVLLDFFKVFMPQYFEVSKPEDPIQLKTLRKIVRWALSGKPKPSRFADDDQWDMANHLYAVTNKKNKFTYDQDFDRLIRTLRADWFLPPSVRKQIAARTHLVEDAKCGFPRPRNFFAMEKNFDPQYRKMLQELRPDWFVTRTDERKQRNWLAYKQRILKKVRRGLRISHAERQFVYLCRTPEKPEHDPMFVSLVDKYRPTWIRRPSLRRKDAK